MDKLIKEGLSKKEAILIAKEIRQCVDEHQGRTTDDMIEEHICCICGRNNRDRGSGRYDCKMCGEAMCGNCCANIYYNWSYNMVLPECHIKINYEYCDTCGIAYKYRKYDENYINKIKIIKYDSDGDRIKEFDPYSEEALNNIM
jgi:hypothetical protein